MQTLQKHTQEFFYQPYQGRVPGKKAAVLLDFVQITTPPLPQFGQLVKLFLNTKYVDLSYIQNDSLSKIPLR